MGEFGDHSRAAYIRAEPVLFELRKYRRLLTYQQFATIKRQALAGDIIGARKGLDKLKTEAMEGKKHGRVKQGGAGRKAEKDHWLFPGEGRYGRW